jgi:hypothetical protein
MMLEGRRQRGRGERKVPEKMRKKLLSLSLTELMNDTHAIDKLSSRGDRAS